MKLRRSSKVGYVMEKVESLVIESKDGAEFYIRDSVDRGITISTAPGVVLSIHPLGLNMVYLGSEEE